MQYLDVILILNIYQLLIWNSHLTGRPVFCLATPPVAPGCLLPHCGQVTHSFTRCVCVCVCPARFFDFKKPGCDTDEARFTALVVKNPPANAGDRRDAASVPGWGDPLEGNRNPLRYSHLENPMDRGAWGLFSSWGREEWTRLKWLSTANHSWKAGQSRQESRENTEADFLNSGKKPNDWAGSRQSRNSVRGWVWEGTHPTGLCQDG